MQEGKQATEEGYRNSTQGQHY